MVERVWLSFFALRGNRVSSIGELNLKVINLILEAIESDKARTFGFRCAISNTLG